MSKTFSFIRAQLNNVMLLSDTANPTSGGGVSAPIGSKYYRGTATAGDFTKTGAGNTAWTQVPSGIYFNVKDPAYGATGDGVTDDRAAIQLAINDAVVAGGCVFFPSGTYLCGKDGANPYSFLLNGSDNVRFLGCGWGGATLKQSGSAGGGAYNLFRINGAANSIEFESLTLDQSGLTNPGADQCHMINVADAQIVKILTCQFKGGVANAGAYVKIGGTAASTVELVWVDDCEMRDAGGPLIWVDGGTETSKVWIIDSTLVQTASEDDTVLIANTVGGVVSDVKMMGCLSENDQKYAAHVNCTTGTLERVQIAVNTLNGFVAVSNADKVQFQANDVNCTVAGISDACVVVEDGQYNQVQRNTVRRASTCADGPVIKVDTCTRSQLQANTWVQETTGAASTIVHLVDSTNIQLQSNETHADDAGATTTDGYLLEAVAVAITDIQLTGEVIAAAAGTWDNAVHVLANGANIGVIQCTSMVFAQCDIGVLFDDNGHGAGVFTDFLMVAGGTIDAATAAFSVTVSGVYIRIGTNACTFGPQWIAGNGDPENNVTARIGSMYSRMDGGAASSLYIKESGTSDTGWAAK